MFKGLFRFFGGSFGEEVWEGRLGGGLGGREEGSRGFGSSWWRFRVSKSRVLGFREKKSNKKSSGAPQNKDSMSTWEGREERGDQLLEERGEERERGVKSDGTFSPTAEVLPTSDALLQESQPKRTFPITDLEAPL